MRMLLVGAGQLAQVLSQLAVAMDFEVIVTDTRREVLDQWAGPPVSSHRRIAPMTLLQPTIPMISR